MKSIGLPFPLVTARNPLTISLVALAITIGPATLSKVETVAKTKIKINDTLCPLSTSKSFFMLATKFVDFL